VFLWHVFLVKPFAALSVVICLATILACVLLERRRPAHTADRYLIGVLGLLSVYQGLRILQGAGILSISRGSNGDDAIELVITGFCLIAALLLRMSAQTRFETESAMRLVQAAPRPASRRLAQHRLAECRQPPARAARA